MTLCMNAHELKCTASCIVLGLTAILMPTAYISRVTRAAPSDAAHRAYPIPIERGEATPFCSNDGGLHKALIKRGFIVHEMIQFDSGAWIGEYYMASENLWVAHWPDGRECLIEGGALTRRPFRNGP